MARPQLENGHLLIANELADVFGRTYFNSAESRILWVVLRRTYGWHKKTDRISFTQFASETGLDRWQAARAVKRLIQRHIINREGVGHTLEYGLQKDYDVWQNVDKTVNVIIDDSINSNVDDSVNERSKQTLTIQPGNVDDLAENVDDSVNANVDDLRDTQKKEIHNKIHITKYNVVLPDWINPETWDDFLEMRKLQKAPPTERAKTLLVNQLAKLKAEGQDPNKVLEQSTMNNWKGLFALKENGGNGYGRTRDSTKLQRNPRNFENNPCAYTGPESYYGVSEVSREEVVLPTD